MPLGNDSGQREKDVGIAERSLLRRVWESMNCIFDGVVQVWL